MLILVCLAQRVHIEVRPLILGDALLGQEESSQSFIASHKPTHLIFIQREQAVHRSGHILGRFTGHGGGEDDLLPDAQRLQTIGQPLLF